MLEKSRHMSFGSIVASIVSSAILRRDAMSTRNMEIAQWKELKLTCIMIPNSENAVLSQDWELAIFRRLVYGALAVDPSWVPTLGSSDI